MAYRTHCLVCAGTGCVSNKSFETARALEAEVARRELGGEVQVIRTGCQGFCAEGPIIITQPEGIFYCGVQPQDVPNLVEEHFVKGRPVKKLMYTKPVEKRGVADVLVTSTGCAGLCSMEPMMTVELQGAPPVKYVKLDPKKVRRVFAEHVVGGALVREWALAAGSETAG